MSEYLRAAAAAAAKGGAAATVLLRGLPLQQQQQTLGAAAGRRLQRLQAWCLLLQNRETSNVSLRCCVNRSNRHCMCINEADCVAAAAGTCATTPAAVATRQKLVPPAAGERSHCEIPQAAAAAGGREGDGERRPRRRGADAGTEQRLPLLQQRWKFEDLFQQQQQLRQQQQQQQKQRRRRGRSASCSFGSLTPAAEARRARTCTSSGGLFVWTHLQLRKVCTACRKAGLGRPRQQQQWPQPPEQQQPQNMKTLHEGISCLHEEILAAGGQTRPLQHCSLFAAANVPSATAATVAPRLPAGAAAVAAWPPAVRVPSLLSTRAAVSSHSRAAAAASPFAAGAARKLSVAHGAAAGADASTEPLHPASACPEALMQQKLRVAENSPTEAAAPKDRSQGSVVGSGCLQSDFACSNSASSLASPTKSSSSSDYSSNSGDSSSSGNDHASSSTKNSGGGNSSDNNTSSNADSSSCLPSGDSCSNSSVSDNAKGDLPTGSRSPPTGSSHSSNITPGSSRTNLDSSCSGSSRSGVDSSSSVSSTLTSSCTSGERLQPESELPSATRESEESRQRWRLRHILLAAAGGGLLAAYGYLLVQCDFNVAKTEWLVGERLRSLLLEHTRDERRDAADRTRYQVGLPEALTKEVATYFLQLDLDKPNGVRRSDALALAQQLGFATNTSEACRAFVEAGSGRTVDVKRRSGTTLQEFAELFERLLQELELPAACAAGFACHEAPAADAEERPAAAAAEKTAAAAGCEKSAAGSGEQEGAGAAAGRAGSTADDDASASQRASAAGPPGEERFAAETTAARAPATTKTSETGERKPSQRRDGRSSTDVLFASAPTDGGQDLLLQDQKQQQQVAAATGKSRRTQVEERMLKFFVDSNQNTVMPGTAPPCYSEEELSAPLTRSVRLDISSSSSKILQQQHQQQQQQQQHHVQQQQEHQQQHQQLESPPSGPPSEEEEKQALHLEIQRTERFLSAYRALQKRRELSEAETLRLKDLQHTLKSLKHEMWRMEQKH